MRVGACIFAWVVSGCCFGQGVYQEALRPQVHYSPREHWMNDPNGLVYFEGEYHLFYQYNGRSMVPEHVGWGHAVSKDLLHWEELGEAIPEVNGEAAFTGSAVVDAKNTSGLCERGKACLVAIYTGNVGSGPTQREWQNIASSQDRGRTWQRYAGNPVLDLHTKEFRDPGVSWNEQAKAWVMAVSMPNEHQVAFYTSPDLKKWTETSRFGPAGQTTGQWECPDLLKVPGAGRDVWALKVGINPGSLQGGSGEQYFLGNFDGKTFTSGTEAGAHGWSDYGKDSYCAISYNDLPKGEKPTLIGWMDDWQYADKLPTTPWRGQMTMPRRVTAVKDGAGLGLKQEPVVESLRVGKGIGLSGVLRAGEKTRQLATTASPAEFTLSFDGGETFGVRLYSDAEHWTEIGMDRSAMILYVDRTKAQGIEAPANFSARTEAPLAARRTFDLHVVVDRSSVEVFAQDGTVAMTNLILPKGTEIRVEMFRGGGKGAVKASGRLWPLRPIWGVTGK